MQRINKTLSVTILIVIVLLILYVSLFFYSIDQVAYGATYTKTFNFGLIDDFNDKTKTQSSVIDTDNTRTYSVVSVTWTGTIFNEGETYAPDGDELSVSAYFTGGTLYVTASHAAQYWIIVQNASVTVKYSITDYYTVTFNLNGGDHTGGGALSQQVESGYGAIAPTTSRSGYVFAGWDKSFNNVTSNMTVTAKWTQLHTVTFNYNGGSRTGGGSTQQSVPHGGSATAPTVWRQGYNHTGWSRSLSNITSSVTITAQWSAQTYSISYALNGGSFVDDNYPKTHTYDTSTSLVDPVREGYDFKGWYTVSDLSGNAVKTLSGTGYTSTIYLYAKWEIKTYTVKFVLDGGTLDAGSLTQTVNHGSDAVAPETSKRGYTLTGWDKPLTNITEGVTITAQWEAQTYSVDYSLNGGSFPDNNYPKTHTYDQVTNLVAPEWHGWRFEGWYLNSDFSGSAVASLSKTGYIDTIQLYAKWKDITLPQITFCDTSGTAINNVGTNGSFYADMTDNESGIKLRQYRISGSTAWLTYSNKTILSKNYTVYEFRAEDNEGNSQTASMYLCTITAFGNFQPLRQNYSVTNWFLVTLPGRIFTTSNSDIAGKYTFVNYADALKWAMAKEYEFRVIDAEDGFIYVTTTNEAVNKLYTDAVELNNAIKFYAEKYISEVTYSRTGNSYNTTMTPNGTQNVEALLSIDLQLPSFLSAYSGLKLTFVNPKTQLQQYKYALKAVTSEVKLTYLASDVGLATNVETVVPYGQTINQALSAAGTLKQGYYLYSETDSIGNAETFLIYLDCSAPTISATYTTGSGSSTVDIDTQFYNTYGSTFYFLSFAINQIHDIDSLAMVQVVSSKLNTTYTSVSEMPTLNRENTGGGAVTLYLFDRSLNVFTIQFFISQAEPTLSLGSLSNKTKLSVYINLNDKNNTLLSLQIFRVLNDGSYVELSHDSNGVAINASETSYTLTEGGKYVVRYTDIYGRDVEFESFFYQKDLPTASLTGVTNGGVTNSSVTVTFARSNSFTIFYIDELNNRIVLNDELYNVATTATNYTLTFVNNLANNLSYVIYLWKTDNDTLFNEYKFSIDTVIATYSITEIVTGKTLKENSTTTKGFVISSQEAISVRYKAYGSAVTKSYTQGSEFNQSGLFTFTVTDSIGNKIEFTMNVDNTLDFSIVGKHTLTNSYDVDTYNPITLTITEQYTLEAATFNGDKFTFTNGMQFNVDGVYKITARDMHGNMKTITVTLDTADPVFEINVENGSVTKESVVLSFPQNVTAQVNGQAVTSGQVFTDDGNYTAIMTGKNGKSIKTTWTIDTGVAYRLSLANGQITTFSVSLYLDEQMKSTQFFKNGESISAATSFKEGGSYEVILTDIYDNTATLFWTIVPSLTTNLTVTLYDGYTVSSVEKDGAVVSIDVVNRQLIISESGLYIINLADELGIITTFEVTIDNIAPTAKIASQFGRLVISDVSKSDTTIQLFLNGEEIAYKASQQYSQPGTYIIVLTDSLGNSTTFEFELEYSFNEWAIVVVAVVVLAVVAIVVIYIKSKKIKA